ncbi:MAG TPA: hypothetical protein PLJ29_02130 [Leptospiraceae bacterium]|nr:hypothetical protein [Leptospiraceae bacterium]HMY66973.1 hypothetical protein [Leptospiraceae bacterium]HNF24519.1 hypothetical protein [Leptospiraceae bacterium]HNI25128.1 hypothetical protein [Leptospiraceae bacterium]HNI94844.1 hypothetical protein [Leptospiraceae bacterium]
MSRILPLPFLFFITVFPLFSEKIVPQKISYLNESARAEISEISFGKTAPRRFEEIKNIREPELKDFQLKMPSDIPSVHIGPDGGEVRIISKNNYQWKRMDQSLFAERPDGSWQLTLTDGTVFSSLEPCAGCMPSTKILYKDGTELYKKWIKHRKEHDWIFQKEDEAPALHWKLTDSSKFQHSAKFSKYTFYYSSEWDSFIKALKERFPGDAFFDYMKNEFGLENAGQVPVILFSDRKSLTAYAGRDLPGGEKKNGNGGGGFGGRDSIVIAIDKSVRPLTGDSEVDDYIIKKISFRTLYHESIHNLIQLSCVSQRIGKTDLKPYIHDPWFNEGTANFSIQKFYPAMTAEVYNGLDDQIKNNKIPSSYSVLMKKKYDDLLPYRLGAYMVEYLYRTYGSESFKEINKGICLGNSAEEAIRKTVGISGDQLLSSAVADFKARKSSLMANIKKIRVTGYKIMKPENPDEFDQFLESGISFDLHPRSVENYDQIPSIGKIFQSDVKPYLNKVSGYFDGPGDSVFFLFDTGTYRWTGPGWKAVFFPNSRQFQFISKGWVITEWANGKKRLRSPDKASVLFLNRKEKKYSEKPGAKSAPKNR